MWQSALFGVEAVYNIGGHSTITIAELARMNGQMVGVPVTSPGHSAEMLGAPAEVRLDLTRAETEFGKVDYVDLQDGLRATVDWQAELYRHNDSRAN